MKTWQVVALVVVAAVGGVLLGAKSLYKLAVFGNVLDKGR